MKYLFALTLIVVLIVAGCAGPHSVRGGEVTDIITNTEARNNGYYMVWVKTDVTAVYCTNDAEVYGLAQQFREQVNYVTMEYQSINVGDKDGAFLGSGCDPEEEGVQTYRILNIRLADTNESSS